MKFTQILFQFIALLNLFSCFDKLDHEIFEIQQQLTKLEGPEATFYSVLKTKPEATERQIIKAYRKVSLAIHPDKVSPSDKKAIKKYALLTSISKMLKEPESRTRYDFYLKNGFPKWRGTGYLYNRYRPGLISVVIFLLAIASGTQYIIGWVNYYRQKERLQYFLEEHQKELTPKNIKRIKKEYADNGYKVPTDEEIQNPPELNWELLEKPSIGNLIIFKLPNLILGLFSSSGKKQSVEPAEATKEK